MGTKNFIIPLSIIAITIFFLSCENDVVDNNSTTQPMIKSDSVLIINANTVVFTAFLNTQKLPVSYYVEYGDSTTYGHQTHSKTIDSTNEAYIKISDTVSTIVANTIYHYRTVVTNSEGQYVSTDKMFSTTFHNPPLFSYIYADDITTIGARLVGNFDPNGNNITSHYFEYGLTKDYDNRTLERFSPEAAQSITRITNLKFGEQYHYRLYLKTTRGDVWSEDKTFNTIPIINPVEFNYPFSIGAKWIYRYILYYTTPTATSPPSEVRNGIHTWEVVSVETINDSIICNIVNTAKDTVYRRVQIGEPPDTTYEEITSAFTIVVFQYLIYPNWDKAVRFSLVLNGPGSWSLKPIPRYIEYGTVYVNLDQSFYKYEIGLTDYNMSWTGNHESILETLHLIAYSIP